MGGGNEREPASEPTCAGGRGAAAAFFAALQRRDPRTPCKNADAAGRRSPLYVEWQKRGTSKMLGARLRSVQVRDGWAVDGTKKETEEPRRMRMRAAHLSECSLRPLRR